MTYNRISNQVRRTEDALLKASSERSRLWEMILPYMSEEFHDETCYIDEAHGDGLVVVFEDEFNTVKNYPVSQIVYLIEQGMGNINSQDLIPI